MKAFSSSQQNFAEFRRFLICLNFPHFLIWVPQNDTSKVRVVLGFFQITNGLYLSVQNSKSTIVIFILHFSVLCPETEKKKTLKKCHLKHFRNNLKTWTLFIPIKFSCDENRNVLVQSLMRTALCFACGSSLWKGKSKSAD